ncbi:MAG: TlpA disulfide reductase family protein [Methylococcales bacterium]
MVTMKKYRGLFCAVLMMLIINTANAEMAILPFTKDSYSEIKAQHQDKPFVLVFWSESCSYCMKELALFGKLYKQYPEVEWVVVATDPFLEDEIVNNVLNRSQLELKTTWVFAEQFPEKIYYKVDKRWRGELPATHFFDRNNNEIRHMGMLKEDELVQWLDEQTAL